MMRPGADTVAHLGGLGRFAGWDGLTLTDSGGFQVVSLGELRKITEDGVRFRSHLDGALIDYTPEHAIAVQEALGSDIAVCLDQPVPPGSSSRREVAEELARRGFRVLAEEEAQRAVDLNFLVDISNVDEYDGS